MRIRELRASSSIRLPTLSRPAAIGLLLVAFLAVAALRYQYLLNLAPGTTHTIDWTCAFRPAALSLLAGESPYAARFEVGKCPSPVYAPPWVLGAMIPLALLPPKISSALIFAASWFGFLIAAYRLGAKPLSLAIFALSYPVILSSLLGNLELLVLLGVTMPPQIGLFFVLAKPQVGIGVAFFWLLVTWQKGGLKQTVRVFAPAVLAQLAAFALFGIYLTQVSEQFPVSHNASVFPYGIPIGIALIYYGWKKEKLTTALAGSPFLSPYVAFNSWISVLPFFFRQPVLLAIVVVVGWALTLYFWLV